MLVYSPSWIRFQPHPPLGIATLAASLKSTNHKIDLKDLELEVFLINAFSENKIDLNKLTHYPTVEKYLNNHLENPDILLMEKEVNNIYRLIQPDTYDLIGFSCMSMRQFTTALIISHKIKHQFPRKIITMGGEFVTKNIEKVINKYQFIDYCFENHAFITFPQLLRSIETNDQERLFQIPGIYFKGLEKITQLKSKDIDINQMPCPNYDTFKLIKYKEVLNYVYKNDFNYLILKYLFTTGCTQNCTYCNRQTGVKLKLKKIDKIVKEISYLSSKYNTTLFSFECNEINPNEKWMDEFCNKMKTAPKEYFWYAYARPTNLSKNQLKELYEIGCRILRMGVESGSQKVLDHMRKELLIPEIEAVLKESYKIGIWNHVNLIAGYCNESVDDVNKTISFIKNNSDYIDSIKINPFYLHSDSLIMKKPKRYGIEVIKKDIDIVEFQEIDGMSWVEIKSNTLNNINRIYNEISKYNIGFTGSSMDLLLSSLSFFKSKNKVKEWLLENHPSLYRNIPVQEIMWNIYHPYEKEAYPYRHGWDTFIGQWGGSFDII